MNVSWPSVGLFINDTRMRLASSSEQVFTQQFMLQFVAMFILLLLLVAAWIVYTIHSWQQQPATSTTSLITSTATIDTMAAAPTDSLKLSKQPPEITSKSTTPVVRYVPTIKPRPLQIKKPTSTVFPIDVITGIRAQATEIRALSIDANKNEQDEPLLALLQLERAISSIRTLHALFLSRDVDKLIGGRHVDTVAMLNLLVPKQTIILERLRTLFRSPRTASMSSQTASGGIKDSYTSSPAQPEVVPDYLRDVQHQLENDQIPE